MMIVSPGRPSFNAVSRSYRVPEISQKSSLVASFSAMLNVIPVLCARKNVAFPWPERYHPWAGTIASTICSPSSKMFGTCHTKLKFPFESVVAFPIVMPSIESTTDIPSSGFNRLSPTNPSIVVISSTANGVSTLTSTYTFEKMFQVPLFWDGKYPAVPVNLVSNRTGPRVASAGTGWTALNCPVASVVTLVRNNPPSQISIVCPSNGLSTISINLPWTVRVSSLSTWPPWVIRTISVGTATEKFSEAELGL